MVVTIFVGNTGVNNILKKSFFCFCCFYFYFTFDTSFIAFMLSTILFIFSTVIFACSFPLYLYIFSLVTPPVTWDSAVFVHKVFQRFICSAAEATSVVFRLVLVVCLQPQQPIPTSKHCSCLIAL